MRIDTEADYRSHLEAIVSAAPQFTGEQITTCAAMLPPARPAERVDAGSMARLDSRRPVAERAA